MGLDQFQLEVPHGLQLGGNQLQILQPSPHLQLGFFQKPYHILQVLPQRSSYICHTEFHEGPLDHLVTWFRLEGLHGSDLEVREASVDFIIDYLPLIFDLCVNDTKVADIFELLLAAGAEAVMNLPIEVEFRCVPLGDPYLLIVRAASWVPAHPLQSEAGGCPSGGPDIGGVSSGDLLLEGIEENCSVDSISHVGVAQEVMFIFIPKKSKRLRCKSSPQVVAAGRKYREESLCFQEEEGW